jgi:hypothetical protein
VPPSLSPALRHEPCLLGLLPLPLWHILALLGCSPAACQAPLPAPNLHLRPQTQAHHLCALQAGRGLEAAWRAPCSAAPLVPDEAAAGRRPAGPCVCELAAMCQPGIASQHLKVQLWACLPACESVSHERHAYLGCCGCCGCTLWACARVLVIAEGAEQQNREKRLRACCVLTTNAAGMCACVFVCVCPTHVFPSRRPLPHPVPCRLALCTRLKPGTLLCMWS